MDIEFQYNNQTYFYEAEDFEVLCVYDQDDNIVEDYEIYKAAEEDNRDNIIGIAEMRREQLKQLSRWLSHISII